MALCGDIRRNDNRPVANCGFAFCWLSTNTAWKDRVYRSTPSCRARTIRQAASSFSSLTCNGCFLSGLRSTGPSPNPFSGRFRFAKKSLATSDFYRSALVTMDCRYLNIIETWSKTRSVFGAPHLARCTYTHSPTLFDPGIARLHTLTSLRRHQGSRSCDQQIKADMYLVDEL
jgi:hypothetical protein